MKLFLLLLLVVLFVACKDDQLYGINADTKTYMLANKRWQAIAIFTKSPQGIVLRDDYILLPDYQKDDYYFLKSDSTFELNDNTNLHPGAQTPILATGTWKLAASDTYLELKSDNIAVIQDPLAITSISGTEFSVEVPVPEGRKFMSFRALK